MSTSLIDSNRQEDLRTQGPLIYGEGDLCSIKDQRESNPETEKKRTESPSPPHWKFINEIFTKSSTANDSGDSSTTTTVTTTTTNNSTTNTTTTEKYTDEEVVVEVNREGSEDTLRRTTEECFNEGQGLSLVSENINNRNFEVKEKGVDIDNEGLMDKTKGLINKKSKYMIRKTPSFKEPLSFREIPIQKLTNGSQTEDAIYYSIKNKLQSLEEELNALKAHIKALNEVKENLLANMKAYEQTNKTLSEYFELTCREKNGFLSKLRKIEDVCYEKPNKNLVRLIMQILNDSVDSIHDNSLKNKETCLIL